MSVFPVFLVQDYGELRNRHHLWAQTSEARGIIYNVIGPVNNSASQYETKPTYVHPSKSMTFVDMHVLGQILSEGLPRMDEIRRGNQPPHRQMCDSELLYPDVPLRRCQEWTRRRLSF
ncbi:hypothetical protein MY4824_009670 [Beauveria thailandica]